ncbi:DUF5996 family protein [Lysobacter sp. D1-1-M9]
MSAPDRNKDWPALPYPDWAETCTALHLWSQIVGKYRFAHAPWVNHSWQATLYVTPRGLTTGAIPDCGAAVTLTFDFRDHALIGETRDARERFPLEAMSVAEFLDRTTALVKRLGGRMDIHGAPNEMPDAIPFSQDTTRRPYDREAVQRFHQAVVQIERMFTRFRTGYLGKVSPVHLFWGSFDLAVTRFSDRQAPRHPGGVPALPDSVTEEAYSHEVSSAGFWPGGGGVEEPMFYSYAYRGPTASPAAPSNRTRPATTERWASSCCPTRPCGPGRIRAARSWRSCSRPTKPRRRQPFGIGKRWSATSEPRRCRARYSSVELATLRKKRG